MYNDHSQPDPDHVELEASMYIASEESYGLPYLDRKQLTEWRQSQRTHAERNMKLHRDGGFLFFESGGGSPYWWPKSTHVYNVLVELIVSEYSRRGFCEVGRAEGRNADSELFWALSSVRSPNSFVL
ncbi:hypothetical protein ANCCEY_06444 [Ancylostoma ceylanicum]|uniref:Uncharacterized protein n=1 Tax=Ancylostoma ceylanicum TaxID=53326 RepID=A0A0D6LRE4_9BILA|nr:hypothetical protein ANCCEY_06444 [Ancylostoma ceylanicum]